MVRIIEKCKQKDKFSSFLFAGFVEMMYFCNRNYKINEIMTKLNAYFYGYYFYFTSSCEAGSRK